MAEGLVIPISTPGGEESAAVLDRIADKLEEVGGAAGASATKMGTSATASSAAIGRIADATEKTKTAVERLEESGNRGLHALSEKASELAGSMGGAAGKIADVGLKSLAAFGGIGLQATAAVGAVLMLYNAYQQYEEKQRAVSAGAAALASVNAQLGGSYDAVRLAAAQDGTAEERTNAIRAAGILIRQQRIALDQQGFSVTASNEFGDSLDRIMAAYAGLGATAPLATREMVQHAIQSGNAAEQQRLLGFSFEHSTDATVEHANQTRALTIVSGQAAASSLAHREELRRAANAAVVAARATVATLNEQADSGAAGDRAISALNTALAEQARLNRQVASATASNTRMQQDATVAAQELAAAAAAADEEGKRRAQQQVSDAAKERRRAAAGGGSAPSAQELRAQAEALRLAREANDNAVLSASVEQQTAQAREHLAFTTRELALAEASRHDHTRRVTSALQAQSQAQAEYNRSLGAEVAAARARVTAEDALIESQRALRDAAEASLRTGADQLRQADARSLSMRRAREDAEAANAAAMGGGATGAESAGISTGESARAALMTEEVNATRELARATQDLTQARREENDASISFEERTTRSTDASLRHTRALIASRSATAALNAEANKIRTDRTDALAASAKGLGDGLVSAGLAAAFAGENIGDALQKQLAASLQALAIESAQKALYSLAQGFLYLATPGMQASAAASFTSAAIFGSVAIGAGVASAAIAPSAAPAAAAGGAGAGRAGDVTPSGAGGMGGGSGAGPIVNNYYAPIVGGRQSTDAETGVRIDRYNDAARARLRRAA